MLEPPVSIYKPPFENSGICSLKKVYLKLICDTVIFFARQKKRNHVKTILSLSQIGFMKTMSHFAINSHVSFPFPNKVTIRVWHSQIALTVIIGVKTNIHRNPCQDDKKVGMASL